VAAKPKTIRGTEEGTSKEPIEVLSDIGQKNNEEAVKPKTVPRTEKGAAEKPIEELTDMERKVRKVRGALVSLHATFKERYTTPGSRLSDERLRAEPK
jgi:hypothetical protein